jgi:hypothetical protein
MKPSIRQNRNAARGSESKRLENSLIFALRMTRTLAKAFWPERENNEEPPRISPKIILRYTRRKPRWSTHSSASVATQTTNNSSIATPMSTLCDRTMSPGVDRVSRKPPEVPGHRLSIMGNENAPQFGGHTQHVWIGYTDNATVNGAQTIKRRFPAAQSRYDLVIEISVRQEPQPHELGVLLIRRASASLA